MPEGKAKSKYVRIAPKKVRQVTDLVKGKDVEAIDRANYIKENSWEAVARDWNDNILR